jgi:hypothetical protein
LFTKDQVDLLVITLPIVKDLNLKTCGINVMTNKYPKLKHLLENKLIFSFTNKEKLIQKYKNKFKPKMILNPKIYHNMMPKQKRILKFQINQTRLQPQVKVMLKMFLEIKFNFNKKPRIK